MSDDPNAQAEAGQPAEAGQSASQHSEAETRKLIHDLREEAKSHRLKAEATQAKLAEIETKQREADSKRLQEEGQFKTLYEQKLTEAQQLEQQAKRLTPYEEAFRKTLEQRIAQIPEANRSLVPDFDDPLKTSMWLDANMDKLGARPFPNLNPGAGNPGASGGNGTSAQVDPAQVETLMKIAKVPRERAMEMLSKR